jgi:hypothetical protein
MTVELNVIDKNVPEVATNDESVLASLSPLTVSIAKTASTVVKKVRPKVTNADIIPVPEVVTDAIQVSIDLNGCPGITADMLDMDLKMAGLQDTVSLKGGASALGSVRLTVDAGTITTISKLSPTRCTAVVSAAIAGNPGPDNTNNATKLVIDVVDKHDF